MTGILYTSMHNGLLYGCECHLVNESSEEVQSSAAIHFLHFITTQFLDLWDLVIWQC